MVVGEAVVRRLKCGAISRRTGKVCGHKWSTRGGKKLPQACPKCHSKNWNQ